MTILSSRDHTCIQETNKNKTELCNELLDPLKVSINYIILVKVKSYVINDIISARRVNNANITMSTVRKKHRYLAICKRLGISKTWSH